MQATADRKPIGRPRKHTETVKRSFRLPADVDDFLHSAWADGTACDAIVAAIRGSKAYKTWQKEAIR